jgi:transposase
LVGVGQFPTSAAGNRALLVWLKSFGTIVRVGVEGTGSYGAPLARSLRRAGVEVLEVDRPNRQERRRKGKTDVIDAIEAARAAQGQRQLGAAKTRDGNIEAIRALVVAKRSAKFSKIAALNQIRHLGFTAPEEIRQPLAGLTAKMVAKQTAAMRGCRRTCSACAKAGELRHEPLASGHPIGMDAGARAEGGLQGRGGRKIAGKRS